MRNRDRTTVHPRIGTYPIGRRTILKGLGASAGLVCAPAFLKGARAAPAGGLFTLGVASGDPRAESVVLWTRLAPDPLNGGGLGNSNVPVHWTIATDPGMASVIAGGTVTARATNAHTIHVVADGLPESSWLYYRFSAMGESSRIGRTRTFPRPGAQVERMRCALVSCQNFVQGRFRAYADLAEQDLDFVLHVGDYIYESGASASPPLPDRNHNGGEVFSVADYRNRYALYRLDSDLQDAHARFPFIVTWDDHEVDNNYAGNIAEETAPFQGAEFLQRRRNAYKVYSEMMPLRSANRLQPNRSSMTLYRELEFGGLADIFVLDTRQFRTDQPAADGFGSTDPDSVALEPLFQEELFDADGINASAASMMGASQELWLAKGLAKSRAKWNVLAQQVMVAPWNLVRTAALTIENDPTIPAPLKAQLLQAITQVDSVFNVDAWDGYPAARRRLLQMLALTKPRNPVVLTGDIHSAWAANLLSDFSDPESDVIAAEFVSTSISSTFLAQDPRPTDFIVRPGVAQGNPHIEFFNALFRGYCICDVDANRWETTYRAVGTLADTQNPDPLALTPMENSTVETDAVIRIESGFNKPASGKRLETTFARFPLA